MKEILKFNPVVFSVSDTYHIMVPTVCETLMWVKVGNDMYFDESNGVMRSDVTVHRMIVPLSKLDEAKEYTIYCRKVIERKSYYSETSEIKEMRYDFFPVSGENIRAYHISDAHTLIDAPIKAASLFEERYGKLSFLILNGDISSCSQSEKDFYNIYEIASKITHGNIPVVFSRGNHETRGVLAEKTVFYTPCNNGNTYYTVRLGNIWAIVLDCGEDKSDERIEYGNTICFHTFRKKVTEFIENTIANAENEYDAEGVKYKLVIVHNPFTRKFMPPFNIEEELYSYWAKLLKENVKPHLMICGHKHEISLDMPGCENDVFGQPCPVVIASKPDLENKCFAGAGFVFGSENIEIIFNNNERLIEKHSIKMKGKNTD